ncbi:TetR/AcrR family transcriptional regulator [Candidatus Thioglobus sp.]|uniref:TetR/AcrR family transcriptional regulator n=1 Tax=Candidatus Thioglobus sp. TaxID=2026721 RepID=UPI003D14E1A1
MKNNVGRPKTFVKDEILKLAMHHFWEYGYDSTSLDDLLLAMGIKKSSFYSTFKSKEELFSNCLSLYREEISDKLNLLREDIGEKQAMLMLTTITVNELRDTGKVKGCLLMNSGKECYKKYNNLSSQITKEFGFMQKLFTEFIYKAQQKGEILNKKDAKVISGRYMNSLNGLIVSIQAGASNELVADLVKSLEEMIE